MSQTISVEVENYGQGGDGPYRAGMAVVKLNGEIIARLRTQESMEFTIHEPHISTESTKIFPAG